MDQKPPVICFPSAIDLTPPIPPVILSKTKAERFVDDILSTLTGTKVSMVRVGDKDYVITDADFIKAAGEELVELHVSECYGEGFVKVNILIHYTSVQVFYKE